MIKADIEKRLAGKWIVWWKHESRAIVVAGNVTGSEYVKIWRYGQVLLKAGKTVFTKEHERVPVRDAYIVEEMAWPEFTPGSYRSLTQSEFDDLTSSRQ